MVEEGGGTDLPVGSRVMFFGAYGVLEDGTYSEWIPVRKDDLCLIPDNVDDVSARAFRSHISPRRWLLPAPVFMQARPCLRQRSEDQSATR